MSRFAYLLSMIVDALERLSVSRRPISATLPSGYTCGLDEASFYTVFPPDQAVDDR